MPKKFDTNPLDPDFPERVKSADETAPLPQFEAETTRFKDPAPSMPFSDNATARFQDDFSQYMPPPNSSVAPRPLYSPPNRKVAKIGLPENICTMISYLPFWIGTIGAIVQLIMAPKSEGKVRFHAAQGLALHVAIFAITVLLGLVGEINEFAEFGKSIFSLAAFIFLIVCSVKAYKGRPIHIEPLEDLAEWLDEKVSSAGKNISTK